MKQFNTQAIVLGRTDYGEADRIISLLTPDYGKLRLMARGVRRIKSKLAGGIELFSVSQITFIRGRGEIGTLISTRLEKYYSHIVEHLDRTMVGYELIKQLNRATEEEPEKDYFNLLQEAFAALDVPEISIELVKTWFAIQLLKLGGHTINLHTDVNGSQLSSEQSYNFNFDVVAFAPVKNGYLTADHIKLLRLGFGRYQPKTLQQIDGIEKLLSDVTPLVQTMLKNYIRL